MLKIRENSGSGEVGMKKRKENDGIFLVLTTEDGVLLSLIRPCHLNSA